MAETRTGAYEPSEAGREATPCIHTECDRPADPEVGRACCMSCAMAWGTRTAPVHIRRCDLAAGREPTVGFEGEEGTPVTQLPGWHEHPECPDAKGRPLAHLHGIGSRPPHTHRPVLAYGEAVDV